MLSMQEAPWDFGISCEFMWFWELGDLDQQNHWQTDAKSVSTCLYSTVVFSWPFQNWFQEVIILTWNVPTVEISWERELRGAIYSGPPSHNGITGFVEILCVISVSLARVTTQLPSQKRPLSRNLLLGVVYLNKILAHELSRLYICVLHSWLMCLFLVKIYPSWFKKVPKSSSLFEELALNPVTSTPPYLFNSLLLGVFDFTGLQKAYFDHGRDWDWSGCQGEQVYIGRWIDRWICRDRIFTCIFFVEEICEMEGIMRKHSFRALTWLLWVIIFIYLHFWCYCNDISTLCL